MTNAPKLWRLRPRSARGRPGSGGADGLRDRPAETGADGAVCVRHLVRGLDEAGTRDRGLALGEEQRPGGRPRGHRLPDVPRVALTSADEQRSRSSASAEASPVRAGAGGRRGPPPRRAWRGRAGRGARAPRARQSAGRPRPSRASRRTSRELRPLARDHGAGVEVARAHHQAAFGEEERGPERELVRAEQRCHDDVPPGLEPAVDAGAHAARGAVRDERLLGLGEAELTEPRRA